MLSLEGPENGAPVLLSHYLGGRLETFDALLPALAGRRLIRFDTRGHGASDAPEGSYSVAMLGADALSIQLVLANTTPFIPNKPEWDDLAVKARAGGMRDIMCDMITSWLSDGFKAEHTYAVDALVGHMAAMTLKGCAGATAVLR